jgi:hypothetical protein
MTSQVRALEGLPGSPVHLYIHLADLNYVRPVACCTTVNLVTAVELCPTMSVRLLGSSGVLQHLVARHAGDVHTVRRNAATDGVFMMRNTVNFWLPQAKLTQQGVHWKATS